MTMTESRAGSEADDSPEIEFRSDVTVELVRSSARDSDVLFAARVSTKGEQSLEDVEADAERSKGLINFLMRDRHGTPFEHNSMTFYVHAPIFVFREHMRHRIASLQRGERALPRAAAGVLRAGAGAQAGPGGQAGSLHLRRRHRRAARAGRRRDPAGVRRGVRRVPADARRRCRPRGRADRAAGDDLLVDVRHVQRPLADELPVPAHPARRLGVPVLPAA